MERTRTQRDRMTESALPSNLVRNGTSGNPRSLEPATRDALEPRFGHSFANIRVFANDYATQSAESLGAQAYTVGQDIVFGAGRYDPLSLEGRHLIAHELTHTIQQGHRHHERSPRGQRTIRPTGSRSGGCLRSCRSGPFKAASALVCSVQGPDDEWKRNMKNHERSRWETSFRRFPAQATLRPWI